MLKTNKQTKNKNKNKNKTKQTNKKTNKQTNTARTHTHTPGNINASVETLQETLSVGLHILDQADSKKTTSVLYHKLSIDPRNIISIHEITNVGLVMITIEISD